jgi:hypothetical protein
VFHRLSSSGDGQVRARMSTLVEIPNVDLDENDEGWTWWNVGL